MRLLEAAPAVDASIDSMNSRAHFPLSGTITITHSPKEKVDPQSFQMEGKLLDTSFVKDVAMSSNTLVSIYSFQLPAQEKGLYVLPSISVKINGQVYQTIPSTYEVKEETAAQPSISSFSTAAPSGPVIFKLEATVQGPTTLYPGQRTKLFYRISYNRSIDLTRSVLPMVHPAHFQKVGDVQIKDYQQPDVTVQELTQEVEASDLGTFQLGPSLIEGYAYSMQAGQKVYDPTLLKAEAPAVTVEVKPFPISTQPASFTGALGQIRAEASLESSSDAIFIGDNVQVLVKIEGVTNLTELHLPMLQCQPGFSGFFQISDLPPLAEVTGKTKFFHIELRPLTTLIKQVPSIEVSSFDPSTEKYVIQRTAPIPLTVERETKEEPASIGPVAMLTRLPAISQWPTPPPVPVEFESSPVQVGEMKSSWFTLHPHWAFWLLPLAFALLLLQMRWHAQWQRRPRPLVPLSEEMLNRALKANALQAPGGLRLLEQAFWHRLWEKGIIPPGSLEIDQLPQEKQNEQVRSFLFQLQALQYSSEKNFDPLQLRQNAWELFKRI
jgi:hypothetical protein